MLLERIKLPKTRHLPVQLAHAAGVTRRRHAEQCVTTRSEPVIENWSQFCERPDRHYRCEPLPTRQYPNHFNPAEVTFEPAPVVESNVHLFRHLFARMRRGALQDLRIAVIEPLESTIAIERRNVLVHPEAKFALSVSVDFDLFRRIHLKNCLMPAGRYNTAPMRTTNQTGTFGA